MGWRRLHTPTGTAYRSRKQSTIRNDRSYEEQIRGWMAYIARTKTTKQEVVAYARLRHQLANYCQIPLLDFTNAAAEKYDAFRSSKLRVGTMDLRIASIVLVRLYSSHGESSQFRTSDHGFLPWSNTAAKGLEICASTAGELSWNRRIVSHRP